MSWVLLLAVAIAGAAPGAETGPPERTTRLKEMIALEGVRDNQLFGYGLVVGLAGTGDRRQTMFSAQTLSNLLDRMGVSVSPLALQVRNTAAVMVTATLPPFAQPGTRIDITVAAMGDAQNLQGGLLVLTPLRAATGEIFAAAQGPVVTGGFAAGAAGTQQTVNHPTTGRIPAGAIVERPPPSVIDSRLLRLQLRRSDFTNASRIAEAVNQRLAPAATPIAHAENAGVVSVTVPPDYEGRVVDFIARIESLAITTDRVERIVINERTGTIVLGKDVLIRPASILHGTLTVEIETTFAVSQPAPFSEGQTTVVPQVGVGIKEEKARNINLKEGATVEDLIQALQAIGATPRDVIAILQNLRAAGAIEAEIEVI
jgi:flagellar P-ring protein FlgI